jgi:endonuclease/exonuclease/phosphatase (EEP) superfamily protein YafD
MRKADPESQRAYFIRLIPVVGCSAVFILFANPWDAIPFAENDSRLSGTRIASWNVLMENSDLNEFEESLREFHPDLIVLIELSSLHESYAEKLAVEYPYRKWILLGAKGIGVFSKVPGTRIETVDLADLSVPAMEVTIPQPQGRPSLSLLAVHTYSPTMDPSRTRNRDIQLNAVSDWVQSKNGHAIVLGDLNITPWSYPFQRLLKDADLVDSRVGRGLYASWPSQLGSLGIPIDHALVSKDLQVRYRGLLHRPKRSDHRGISLVVE